MNEYIHLKKKTLRKNIRKLKKTMTKEQRQISSDVVMGKVETDKNFQKAKTIFAYWAMDDEIDTRVFIRKWYKKKNFILPTIDGNELILKKYTSEDSMKDGDLYSIPEPKGEAFDRISEIDLAIIPGVAFDKNNNRMGRGKAYYDKILKQIKTNTYLIGVCYDFQYVDKVPVEEHDIKMDKVIHS